MFYFTYSKWFYFYAALVLFLGVGTQVGALIFVLAGASCAGVVFSEAMFRRSVVTSRYNKALFSRSKGAAGATQLGMVIMVLYSLAPDAHLFQSTYILTLVTAAVSGLTYISAGTISTVSEHSAIKE